MAQPRVPLRSPGILSQLDLVLLEQPLPYVLLILDDLAGVLADEA